MLLALDAYERLARDLVLAFDARDEAALVRVNDHYRRSFSFDDLAAEIWRRVYSYRQRSQTAPKRYITPAEAEILVAQDAGFGSWDALAQAIAAGAPPIAAFGVEPEGRIAPRRYLTDAEWDALIAVMRDRRLAALDAIGLMSDAVMERVAALDGVTSLELEGSRELTDEGVAHLARMPQLQSLNLTGCKVTDRGLEVLRHLPNLRDFKMTWNRGITDAGVANLRFCDRLESVDLMGTPTGDGAIEAVQGKTNLRRFQSGRLVTDAGVTRLRDLPSLKELLIDGPFTNAGLASLSGLGITDLDLFWHVTGLTSDGFAHLAALPNLETLGADGELIGDAAMAHLAALPKLRRLRAQESVATDAGFEALSRSRTLEQFWGRVCPNFGSRGFIAFSKMPALQWLGVGCASVDDRALSTLPAFPALRELTPIGVKDDGFRHIGRCPRLEHLQCMYCRETTDASTEHVAALRLKKYYAGLTQITDRSLEILGRMSSLEQVEFYETKGVTDAGLPFLAALPNLREAAFDAIPGVTLDGTRVFPSSVRVRYST